MSTTTMNLKQAQSSLAVPSSSTLLPSTKCTSSHPPIYLKLNPGILEMLAKSSSSQAITLSISERSATLRIKDVEYQGSQYKEPGHVEVYMPEQNNFRNVGRIGSRILIKSEKFVKVPSDPEQIDLTQSTESKIIQLLALKPHSAKSLANKTQTSTSFVQAVLAQVAISAGQDLFTLKKEFTQPKHTSKEAGTTNDVAKLATRERSKETPPDNSIDPKKADTKRVIDSKPTDLRKPDPQRNLKRGSRVDAKRDTKPEEIIKQDDTIGLKRRSAHMVEPTKRARKREDKTDMFELARKFQSAYGEYLELYSHLSNRKLRPASQVQKLLAMHNQLAQWKKTLWSNARSKSQVK